MRTWSRSSNRTSVRTFDRTESGLPPVASDPYFYANTLLLPGNGTNGAQNNTFVDSSTNAFTITRNGNTTQGTFSPFSQTGWSNYFDGTGDALTLPSDSALALGAGDFTVEAWVYNQNGANLYPDIFSNSGDIIAFLPNDRSSVYRSVLSDDNYPGSGNAALLSASATITQNAWTHVAWVRSGSTITVYINGTASGTATSSTNHTREMQVIGAIAQGAPPNLYFWNGYISNLRVVKGTAVYTAAFTPSTTPLTAIANTELLTCQSNRFIDNSSNAFAITVNGNTSIQAFSPFNPTAAWSAATNGGSGYFDGSGDQLGIANNAAFEIGNGDFSYEAWVYALRQTNTFGQGIISYGITGNTGSSTCDLQIRNDGYLQLAYATGASGTLTDSSLFPINQWVHTVACRSGSTLSIFVNGSRAATTTTSATVGTGGAMTIGGQWYANQPERQLQGYISDARVLKGASAYDATQSTITIPTSPVTAITNTELLCNFTNAGIYDATAKNDLETVGNAQISTTQSQWGGSSMYFDGTGDKLLIRNIPELRFGTGDFTIEMWVYLAATGAYQALVEARASNTSTQYGLYISDVDKPYWYDGTSKTSSIAVSGSTWTHIAFVRSSGTLKIYVGGQEGFSGSFTTDVSPTAVYGIGGRSFDNTTYLNGYINDLRVTKGVARYTTAFTPPTAAFPLT